MIVLDASAAVELLLGSAIGMRADRRAYAPGETVHVPQLFDLEVCQALRKMVRTRALDEHRAHLAVSDLRVLRLRRYPHEIFVERVWDLRHNLTAYDAAYVALAESLDAPMLTTDRALAAAPGHRARIELVE